jgi:hypothetical protein
VESKEERRLKNEKRVGRAKALLVDRTPMLLGKYPLKMHMGKPTKSMPSHMPRYKYKEANKPWIKQLDEFRSDCKDKLLYL